jgi:hypothetical protein
MILQDEHIEREAPLAKDEFSLEFDRLGRTTGHGKNA